MVMTDENISYEGFAILEVAGYWVTFMSLVYSAFFDTPSFCKNDLIQFQNPDMVNRYSVSILW